ncbi:serine/threonine protein kinase [Cyanobium sp. PCC 7001]|uniref:serine/threonine protein kinase n=1 Tax=Cyanobium sp. PCC 7001 TaxID=180281 RepID=UPI000180530E|nr:serine/threonine protein kinase [Cyanobium sp. PCC 7001]EDY38723.1 serine/threonine protein kinase [Cyanobium sp. PCC 7001]
MPPDSATPPASSPASSPQPGQLVGERYRLEQRLSQGGQGSLWRARDQLAGEGPVALRQLGPDIDQEAAVARWNRLQGVLHPQVPRLGSPVRQDGDLWLVREWQIGRTFQELVEVRGERQMVFGAGEVLLLLRQLLPVLAVLHGQDLVHGDLCPANLLRRDSDGLPVLLDFGLVAGGVVATPGFAPAERSERSEPLPWMDLHALGVTALVLLSGDPPARLLDPVSLSWRWPAALAGEPDLQRELQRLLQRQPDQRFRSAGQALAAFQAVPMPDSTGPVPRADRTVMLVPPPAPPDPSPAAAAASAAAAAAIPAAPPELPPLRSPVPPVTAMSRAEAREEAAEGGIWPVVIALVLSAVVGTALGWWWLSRGKQPPPSTPDAALQLPSSLPPSEVDQRQQLLNRLRAMQVDRAWFLKLVDASLLAQFPERGGRLPSDALEDAPLRRIWNELAEEWLARVEQLPIELRRRLGNYSNADWERRQRTLVNQGISPEVLRQLVSGSAQNLLPGRSGASIPAEPFRQLWYAAAEQILATVQIEAIQAQPGQTQVVSAAVDAGGARLFPVRLSPGNRLVLGVNGSPLMQMSVFAADGSLLEPKGALRVVSLPAQAKSPVQLLVTNDGVAPAMITLSLRADPPAAVPVPDPPQPVAPDQPSQPQPQDPIRRPAPGADADRPGDPDTPPEPLPPLPN